MKERPIIFSGGSMRAILDGRKTQTRRVVKWPVDSSQINARAITYPEWSESRHNIPELCGDSFHGDKLLYNLIGDEGVGMMGCPQGEPGDQLWVREAWALPPHYDPKRHGDLKSKPSIGPVCFGTDYKGRTAWEGSRWRSPIHMPRWASRLTLEITDVRVERLQEISEKDAISEGCTGFAGRDYATGDHDVETPQEHFANLWTQLNAKRGHPWSSNPWVFVITFRPVDARREAE